MKSMPRRLPKHCVEDVDRYGTVRVYLRIKGRKKVRLTGTPWTADFMEAYRLALTEDAPVERGVKSDSWEWICRRYFEKPTCSLVRQRILARTFSEPLKPGSPHVFGDMPLSAMTTEAIEVLRDRAANNDGPTPEAANARLKAMRQVFLYAVKERKIIANPARDVPYIKHQTDGFYTWTIDDVRAFIARHPLGTKPYLAMCLMLFLGVRRSDVVLLGKQHAHTGKMRFKPKKTRNTTGKLLALPIIPPLRQAIDAGPTGDMTFIVTASGKPFTVNGFGNWFRRRCLEAGLPQCSSHGLRKAATTFAAEGGATDAQLQAMFGWSSHKMPAHYRKAANQEKLADDAMHLIGVQLSIPVGHKAKKEA